MYIRGLIPRNFAELAEAVPIDILNADRLASGLIQWVWGWYIVHIKGSHVRISTL